jgi:hypothetical protein
MVSSPLISWCLFHLRALRSDNKITIDAEESSSLIKGIVCGVVKPGVAVVKTLHLLSHSAAGDRILDISVQTKVPDSPTPVDQENKETRENDVTEKLQTIVVPTVDAFHFTQEVVYQHNLKKWRELTDLLSYDESFVDDERSSEALVVVDVRLAGPWPVFVDHVEYEKTVGFSAFF